MSTDSSLNEDTKTTSLPADVTDDSCLFKYIEIVPLTGDTDGACTTECDSGDWSAQVKQENLSVVKQEPQDLYVCCIGSMQQQFISYIPQKIGKIFGQILRSSLPKFAKIWEIFLMVRFCLQIP